MDYSLRMVKVATDVKVGLDVKGFIPITLLDWEGKVASTIFMGGCNFRCFFCHNPELVLSPHDQPSIPWRDVERCLIARQRWIDGVVVSGGEPCANPSLKGLLREIKALGYAVKLDTNGSFPETLKELISEGLIDFVAMDVKTSFSKYNLIGKDIDVGKIRASIKLILSFRLDHEFRTTVVPGLVKKEDVVEIAQYLSSSGGKRYILQQFKPGRVLTEQASRLKPYRLRLLEEFTEEANKYIPTRLR